MFLTSVGLSVFFYFAAWLAPEPVFTKAFVAMSDAAAGAGGGRAGAHPGGPGLREAVPGSAGGEEPQGLQAVAERFGKAMGGTGCDCWWRAWACPGAAPGARGRAADVATRSALCLPRGPVPGGRVAVEDGGGRHHRRDGCGGGHRGGHGGQRLHRWLREEGRLLLHHLATDKNEHVDAERRPVDSQGVEEPEAGGD